MYNITNGVIKVTVCGETMLVASGEARKKLPYVRSMNAAGAYIWDKLEKQQPMEEIVQNIVADYAISESEALETLQNFLKTLSDAGYISIAEE